jgi:hypothetical protein
LNVVVQDRDAEVFLGNSITFSKRLIVTSGEAFSFCTVVNSVKLLLASEEAGGPITTLALVERSMDAASQE